MKQNETALTSEDSIEEWVYQTIGAASSCWSNLIGAGEFDSTRAKRLGDELLERIKTGDNVVIHEHIWDKWYPYSRNEVYRVCVVPDCHEKQVWRPTT